MGPGPEPPPRPMTTPAAAPTTTTTMAAISARRRPQEVRRRRDEAFAEREFHSYLRRLIQVRQDIVRAERERRSEGRAPDPLIDRITSVLSEGPPRGPARGEALSLGPSPEDIAE